MTVVPIIPPQTVRPQLQTVNPRQLRLLLPKVRLRRKATRQAKTPSGAQGGGLAVASAKRIDPTSLRRLFPAVRLLPPEKGREKPAGPSGQVGRPEAVADPGQLAAAAAPGGRPFRPPRLLHPAAAGFVLRQRRQGSAPGRLLPAARHPAPVPPCRLIWASCRNTPVCRPWTRLRLPLFPPRLRRAPLPPLRQPWASPPRRPSLPQAPRERTPPIRLPSRSRFPAVPLKGSAGSGEFLQQYPQGRYAANAEYWIGECLYAQGKYMKHSGPVPDRQYQLSPPSQKRRRPAQGGHESEPPGRQAGRNPKISDPAG